jgi:hypothetical protein
MLSAAAGIVAALVGVAAVAYAVYVGITWARYGHAGPPVDPAARDEALDRVMPRYEVVERHYVRIKAPARIVLDQARMIDITGATLARAIFRARELLMGAEPARPPSKGLIEDMKAIGWGPLAEIPDHEIVMGAVTRPWEANPVFRAIAPQDFATFSEPDYVQIAWTLRADPVDANASIFRTETRVRATDAAARARFRWYWSLLSPGIILIRWAMLQPLKATAERRASGER